jgi:hypothetical protein
LQKDLTGISLANANLAGFYLRGKTLQPGFLLAHLSSPTVFVTVGAAQRFITTRKAGYSCVCR